MRTYKLYLIRHGATEANEKGLYVGSTDLPLSEQGAADLALLMDEADYPYVERVYVSPMLRARQTADLLYPGVEQIVVDALRETSFGEFEGQSLAALEADERFREWISPAGSFIPNGAENPADYVRRSCEGIVSVADDMMRTGNFAAAVVTHAGVIANALATLAYPKQTPFDWQCQPGCGFVAVADPTIYLREPVFEVTAEIPTIQGTEPADEAEYFIE